jgi:GNAT superfamily N-acetyltransferase
MNIEQSIEIRRGRSAQYGVLNAIKRAASAMVGRDYVRDLRKDIFDQHVGSDDVMVAVLNGNVCGYTLAYRQPASGENIHDLYLRNIFVTPEYTGRGIGTALLKKVIERGEREEVRAITLTTSAAAPFNAPFYQGHGFVILSDDRSKMPFYLWNVLVDEKTSFGDGDVKDNTPENPFLLPRVAMEKINGKYFRHG